jgi:riboflavin synthase
MFTGIVDPGEVADLSGTRLRVRSPILSDCEIGASVSINGVCLTVVARERDECTFDLSEESLARSALGALTTADRVNVERPLRAGAELGGHIVQGHVDGVATVVAVTPDGDGARVRIGLPSELERYVVEKGSITVDGVSLTVTTVDEDAFEVALVPHTLAVTTFADAGPGRRVNLEVDVLAKYVEKMMTPSTAPLRSGGAS